MRLLKDIKDKKLPRDESSVKLRQASRAVLFDKNDLVPLLYVSKYEYHKLPGGGINKGEDKAKALVRECLEEVGCKIDVQGEIGMVTEYRSEYNLIQTSYCYYGRITSKGKSNFTKNELNQGFEVIWSSLEEAIFKVMNDKPKNYEGSFIQKRDLVFLKRAKQLLNKQYRTSKN